MKQSKKLIGIAIISGLVTGGTAHAAAIWGGGTGDWVSDNWGLNSPDGSPGDINYPNEAVTIDTGTVSINAGDSIALSTSPAIITVSADGVVNQSGGTFQSDRRLTVHSQYNLSGGLLTGTGEFYVGNGGEYNISGGEFGNRLNVTTNNSILKFNGTGDGTVNITGGEVDLHTVDMNEQSGNALIEVVGTGAVPQTLFFQLNKSATGTSATASFVFSSSGVSGWKVGSNNALTLGTGANRGLLSVDVSAYTSDGTTGFTLFDYRGAIQGDGTFGAVSILDDHYTSWNPGTLGDLQMGQYFLDMTGGPDNNDIILYFNNQVPEPSAVGMLLLGAFPLLSRMRR